MAKRPPAQPKSQYRSSRDRRAQRKARLNQAKGLSAPSLRPSESTANSRGAVTSTNEAKRSEHRSSLSGPQRSGKASSGQRMVSSQRTGRSGTAKLSPPPRSVSRSDLSQRRKTLKRQRGFNALKGTWRLLAATSAALGLGWFMVQPLWVLKDAQQIEVEGNETISATTIQSLLGLEYPQSLLSIEPKRLEANLQANAPVSAVNVSRRLLPPGLTVHVVERQPVAIAELALSSHELHQGNGSRNQPSVSPAQPNPTQPRDVSTAEGAAPPDLVTDNETPDAIPVANSDIAQAKDLAQATNDPTPNSRSTGSQRRGPQVLMDEAGDWTPLDRYTGKGQVFELPKLRVLGMREEYRSSWAEMYPIIRQSPMEIYQIDWRDPSNLKLKTDLGEAHLGPYGGQFSEQLDVLDRMRSISSHREVEKVDFIDLRSPTMPRLKMQDRSNP